MKGLIVFVSFLIGWVASAKPIVWYHFNEKAPGEHTANKATGDPDILNAADAETGGKDLAAYGRSFNSAHFGGGSFLAACPLYGKALDYGMKWRDGIQGAVSDENSCLNFFAVDNGKDGKTDLQWGVVVLPDDEKIHLATFTVEFFFRFDPDVVLDNTGVRICQLYNNGKTGGSGKFAWQFSINGSGTEIGINVHDASGNSLISSGSGIPCRQFKDGQWHHIAMTLDGDGNLKVYLDYALLKTFEGISIAYGTPGTDTLTIGSAALSYGRFQGAIDEFRLSDAALEPDDFLHMTKPFGDEDVLVYIPCDRTNLTACGVNNVNVAGPGTVPAKVQAMTGGKLPETVTDPSATLSERIRGELLATNDFANGSSYLFATNAGATAVGRTGRIALQDVVDGRHSLFDFDGVTLELFFKADVGNASDNQNFWRLQQESKYTQSYIRKGTGSGGNDWKLQTYINKDGGGYWQSFDSKKVRDGKWHHAAWVFDRTRKESVLYLDYAKCYAFTNGVIDVADTDATHALFLGSHDSLEGSTGFCGQFDEIRITKRALLPREFLTTKELPQARMPTAFYAAFDGDYKNLVFPNDLAAGAKSGTVTFSEKVPGETVPGKADMGFSEITNRSAIANAQGGSIAYANPISIEGLGNQTVEFYVKLDPSVPNWATLVCYQFDLPATDEVYAPYEAGWNSIWSLKLDGSKNLNVIVGTDTVKGKVQAFSTPGLANGRWHHLAVTFAETTVDKQPATEVHAYLDQEELGSFTVSGRMLRRVSHQSGTLRIGCPGDWTTTMVGGIDELRISNAVLTPDKFLTAVRNPRGMILIVK